jgi:hypothetical protein
MTATSLNFDLLDANWPEVARLIAAMVQARDALEHRSWSHPQELTGEEWWADVPSVEEQLRALDKERSLRALDKEKSVGRYTCEERYTPGC